MKVYRAGYLSKFSGSALQEKKSKHKIPSSNEIDSHRVWKRAIDSKLVNYSFGKR